MIHCPLLTSFPMPEKERGTKRGEREREREREREKGK
jgi:hypothetical protein